MKLRPARLIAGLIVAGSILGAAASSQAHSYTELHRHSAGNSQTYHTHWDGCYKHHISFYNVYEHTLHADSTNSTHGHYVASHTFVREAMDVYHEWLYPWSC